jgi:hypothetical protein
MAQRSYKGRIDYIRDNGGVKGREFFSVTVQDDGMRTIRAQCEMDDIGLLRDVVQTVDANWMPVDAFVRLTQKGEFMGGGWFRFDATGVECEAFTRNEGRISQRVETGTPIRIFASHPLMTDGWQTKTFDHASGQKTQVIAPWANPSPRADGGSGPMIGLGRKTLSYAGEERLTVSAGAFACRHYSIHSSKPENPHMETWVTGEDAVLVKMRWDLLKTEYVLAELTGDPR